MIGATWLDYSTFTSHGAAYIYEWDGAAWTEVSRLTSSGGELGNGFGWSVSLHKDRALVSAPYQDPVGSVYLFEWDGIAWNEVTVLTASDGEAVDEFGNRVVIQEDRALIGAHYDEVDGVPYQGSAYVFEQQGDTWNEVAKLTAREGAEDDYFGTSVALDGEVIVVGNRRHDGLGVTDAGTAVVFEHDGTDWVEYTSLYENYVNTENQFGRSVAIRGNRVLVGAAAGDKVNEDGTVTPFTGTVHAFELGFDVPGVLPGVVVADPLQVDFGFVGNEGASAPTPITLTNSGASPIDVTNVTFNGEDADHFSHTFTGTVTLSAGEASTIDVSYTPQLPGSDVVAEGVLYRINAGGSVLEDWEEDVETTPSPYLLPESTTIETTGDALSGDASVPDGTPVDLFATKRLDANQDAPAMEWDFPVVAGGQYEVRLYFVEMSRCAVGNRLFDVEIEGAVVLDNFDIYSEAGSACEVGIMRSHTLFAEDTNLDINFPLVNGKPSAVAGIEIITLTPPIINQTAVLAIEHTGSNGSLFVGLTGETGSSQAGSTLSLLLRVSPSRLLRKEPCPKP